MMETTSNISVDATSSLKRIEHIKAGVIDFTAGSLGLYFVCVLNIVAKTLPWHIFYFPITTMKFHQEFN